MGQLWNGASRMMMTINMNVLWVLTLHYTIGFVAYKKEALAKSRGRREEL